MASGHQYKILSTAKTFNVAVVMLNQLNVFFLLDKTFFLTVQTLQCDRQTDGLGFLNSRGFQGKKSLHGKNINIHLQAGP